MPRAWTWLEPVAVVALAVASLLATRDHQRLDSPTFDEPYHVFAGAEYAEDGTYWLNLEHPPLAKLVAGWALAPLHLVSPDAGKPRTSSPHDEFLRFLYANRAPADTIVAAARRPMPWFLFALVLLTWAAGRALFGRGAGLLAAAIVALDPGFIGNAALVHTDVPAALTMTAAVLLAALAARSGHPALWAAAGGALGIALATKFTAAVLFPAFVVLPFLAARRAPLRRNAGGALLALALSAAVLAACYAVPMRRMVPPAPERAIAWFLGARGAPPATIARYTALSRAVPTIAHWAAGMKGVTLLSRSTRGWNYLVGRVYQGPNALYFPAAVLVKSTSAFLLLAAAAAALGGRRLATFECGALLVPAGLVAASAVVSSFNIGQRHLLPLYPLVALAAAGVLEARLPRRAFVAAGGLLVLLSAVSVARVHPNELSYFNAIAGGPEGGARWLSDSNVDWGQDMKRLALWFARHGGETETTVVTNSGLAANYYSRHVRVLSPDQPIAPGRYVTGATMEALADHADVFMPDTRLAARVGELMAALHARGRRVDRVGGSLTVWELPPP